MLLPTAVNALGLALLTESVVVFGSKVGKAILPTARCGLLLTVPIVLLG